MIEIDGAYGEGGGQLVRLAVALSAMTGKAIRLVQVRANRPRSGLAPQHLAAVSAVARLCDARLEGLSLRTSAFSFEPRSAPVGGNLRVDVGTAGSVTLVLQALLPILFRAREPSHLVVTGGTEVRQAPTWDYFGDVLLRIIGRTGLSARASLARHGYYPRGGGEVRIEVQPGKPLPLPEAGSSRLWHIRGEAHVARLPISIAERMRNGARAALGAEDSIGARVLANHEAVGTGGAITVWADSEGCTLGASSVAERGVRAEALGEAVGAELAADMASGATLDVHAADQILVYMAMAHGNASFTVRRVSSHARTAMWLLEQFLPVRFAVEPEGVLWRISSARA